jgi:signal transduction histidine kinase
MNYAYNASRSEGLPIHEQLMVKTILLKQTRELGLLYGVSAFGYIAFVFVHLFVYSHRLTGPVFKLNQIMKKAIESKEWPRHVSFRKADAFKELASTFNEFVETMSEAKSDIKKDDKNRQSTFK